MRTARLFGFRTNGELVKVVWRRGLLAKIRFEDGDQMVIAAQELRRSDDELES